jgi:hypothetical protein
LETEKKMWIKQYGKNITTFNYYMSQIHKMCAKHPEEVLKRNDSIW